MTRRSIHKLTIALVSVCAAALTGCATTASRQLTATELDRVLAGAHRPEADRARDIYRHPKQTLLFFGLRPDMSVLEISPDGGWYTKVIAPLLRNDGRYLAGFRPLVAGDERSERAHNNFREILSGAPTLLDKVQVVPFSPGQVAIGPENSVDMVLTFRNIHNWMGRDVAGAAFSDMFRVLKPGGVLGVVEHRGNPAVTQDPKAATGYVNQAYAIKLIEAVGFRLVATSEINANPKDTKDYPGGVWTLPPTFAERDRDKARYQAIGESDRFTLKFVKPR
jgi:predicted methyltransferase